MRGCSQTACPSQRRQCREEFRPVPCHRIRMLWSGCKDNRSPSLSNVLASNPMRRATATVLVLARSRNSGSSGISGVFINCPLLLSISEYEDAVPVFLKMAAGKIERLTTVFRTTHHQADFRCPGNPLWSISRGGQRAGKLTLKDALPCE